ncbi:MAG: hypothetical protein WBP40_03940 [Candidatus Moraniibacteriota bacterium]
MFFPVQESGEQGYARATVVMELIKLRSIKIFYHFKAISIPLLCLFMGRIMRKVTTNNKKGFIPTFFS